MKTIKEATLTQEQLMELFHYDPDTGVFTRKTQTSNRNKIGDRAGCVSPDGYRRLEISSICGRKSYTEHRLAILYMTGEWPKQPIDHINGIKHDNRFCNLRVATPSQNQANSVKRSHNKFEWKGVGRYGNGKKYRSSIRVNGKVIHLGCFNCATAAYIAYLRAARQYFGEFARP